NLVMVGIRPLSLAFLMLALLLPASASADEAAQIIVKRDPGLSAAEQRDIRADAGVRLLHTLSIPRTEVVTAPADDASAALRELNRHPDVVYAEKDRIRTSLTNDPAFSKMWGLQNTGQNVFGGGLYDADIDAPEAWTQLMPTLAQGVEVGVVDSGVDAAHEDLDGLVTAYDFVDAANGDPGGEDENGHGTHVAGTIGAIGDNSKGVVGVGRGASIVSLRVLKANGQGYDSDIAEAFDYAGTNGIQIVNASLGGTGFSQTLEEASARNSNVLFVVAAGNG